MEQVMHVAGRDERQARALRELCELRVDPRLLGKPGVLNLDVGRVAPEDLDEPVEVGRRVRLARLLERLRDAPREAAGERDQAIRVRLEQPPVHTRLVVIALQIAR
jgi:hypothetical protein